MDDSSGRPSRTARWPRRERAHSPAGPASSAAPAPAPAPDRRSRVVGADLNRPFVVGFFLALGALLAGALGSAFTSLATIWIYIAFALFASLGLDPLVRRLQSGGVARAWSIVIVCVAFLIVVCGLLWIVIPTLASQVGLFIRGLPSTIDDFQKTEFYTRLRTQFGDPLASLLDELQRFFSNPDNIAAVGGGVLKIGISIGTALSGVIIVVVLTLYFLATLPQMKQALYRLMPARNRGLVAELTEEITASVGGYLGGMVVLAFFNATVTFILYALLGLPFPLLLAVVAFGITIIPLVGPVLFLCIGSIVALFSSPVAALVFAGAYLLYMQIEAYLLTPRVMNRTISVPGSLVVIGALVGGTLMGLLGALVAIPVTASILLIVKKIVIPKQDAKV